MISCIIVDDEPRNLTILDQMIKRYCHDVEILGTATNIEEARTLLQQCKPDFILLDIEMPRGNAFELLAQIMPVSFEVIFVTAYDKYAIQAFRVNALDYLLKPLDIDELKEAIQKVRERVDQQDINARLDSLLKQVREKEISRIVLRTHQGTFFHPIANIVACIAEGAYTRFEFTNGTFLLVTGSLKRYEELLPLTDFCRIHDAYLVNLNHIISYHPGKSGYIEMTNGRSLEISVRRKADFMNRFK